MTRMIRLDGIEGMLCGLADPVVLARSASEALRTLRFERLQTARDRLSESGKIAVAACADLSVSRSQAGWAIRIFCFDFNDVVTLSKWYDVNEASMDRILNEGLSDTRRYADDKAVQVLEALERTGSEALALAVRPQIAWLKQQVAVDDVAVKRDATPKMTA